MIKIDVTQEDINNGIPFSTTSCPIALAMHRTLEKPVWWGVTGGGFVDANGLQSMDFYPDKWVSTFNFVLAFDAGDTVLPFSFTLLPKVN